VGRHSRGALTQGRRRFVAALLASVVVVQVAAGVFVVRDRLGPTAAPGVDAPRGPVNSTAAASARRIALEERAGAVRSLLDDRARAVLTRNRSLFLAGIDPAASAFRLRQGKVFDALAQVPVGSWVYELDADRETPYVESFLGYYRAETWVPQVVLRYQLKGFDDQPTAAAHFFTFVRRGDVWRIGNDDDFPGVPNLATDRELWDFGPVEVVQNKGALVLGRRGRRPLLLQIARLIETAEPRVTAVWGPKWARRVVVLVPETQAELGTLIDEGNDLSQIAAVAVAQLGEGADGPRTVGNRIIVNPPNFARLSPVGRQVVLQHEITHVAARDSTGGASPTWLIEGFADYVGYLGSGVSTRSAARELRADVRSGRGPTSLPGDEEFRGTSPRLAQSYEMSWLAARLIAERTSAADLVRFYRQVGTAVGERDVVLREAFRDVLATTPESFTAAWVAYLRQQLG